MILFNRGHIVEKGENLFFRRRVEAGQKLDLTLLCLDGVGNAEFDIEIVGPGADVSLRGLYICGGEDRLSIKVNLCHSGGGSCSDQLFRGIATGHARVRFDGRIVVAPDAQKTEAYQSSRNLLLSDSAVVETLPQLEIYADDVKCSHGATVGYLDENEQFYMRSRGVSLEQARRLQMLSFLSPVMEGLDEQQRFQVVESLKSMQ